MTAYLSSLMELCNFAELQDHIMRRTLILFSILIAFVSGCNQKKAANSDASKQLDSLYTEKAALNIYYNDPDRALAILDSAQILGNVNDFDADLTRATIYARSMINPQHDKAIEICERLLKDESSNNISNQKEADSRLNILNVILEAYRYKNDYEMWVKYATELAEINRTWGYEMEAYRTDAEIGLALAQLGREDEGIEILDKTLKALTGGPLSIDRMDTYIVACKRRINISEEQGKYEEIIPLAQSIIDRLADYQSHPSDYAEDSYRLPYDPTDRMNYCNFYHAQAVAFLARAYSNMGNLKQARDYTTQFENTEYGHSFTGRTMIAPAWRILKDWDKLQAIDNEALERMGTDTLNNRYALILYDYASMAKSKGHYKEANDYLERYASLKEYLSDQANKIQALEHAAKYHIKEQEIEIEKANAKAKRRSVIIIAILVMLTIAILAAIYNANQRKLITEKNRSMVRLINDYASKKPVVAAKPSSSSKEDTSKPDAPPVELFEEIDNAIRSERLYANSTLQRQDILDRFNMRRQTLNALLTAYAGGDSFPTYINRIRMEEAVKLLREEPDTTIAAVAEEVGLNLANFRIQFKQQYGITPAEYRTNL